MYYTKAIKINNLTVMSWYSFELVGSLFVYIILLYILYFTDIHLDKHQRKDT